jgi:hypothetical protein
MRTQLILQRNSSRRTALGRFLPARKRLQRLIPVLILALGLHSAASLTGCGSGGSGTQASQPQNYTITVQGPGGLLVHTANVQLTVN